MPAKKRALGRGLDAILGSDPLAAPILKKRSSDYALPIHQLRPNPFQPRKQFKAEALEELAASIKAKGVLQPLVVRKVADGYEIVAGERRWRASQRAGLTEVPIILRDFNDQEMLELALIENLQREELSPVEEARAFRQLIEEFELTQEAVAQAVGKSRVAVTNSLRLLRLPDKILDWIDEEELSAGHARSLLGLGNESLQLALAREIMAKGLSVRETERRVRSLTKAPDPQPKLPEPTISIETRDLEEKLTLHLGMHVKIMPKTNDSGKIEVYYSTVDDFQRFFDHLGITLEQEV